MRLDALRPNPRLQAPPSLAYTSAQRSIIAELARDHSSGFTRGLRNLDHLLAKAAESGLDQQSLLEGLLARDSCR